MFRIAMLLLCTFLAMGCGNGNRVVVYCAHDREFAEEILNEFQQQTGLTVVTTYDTEANKAVSLYEDLVREAGRPRCDVHWNNEILNTIRLQNQGIYEPYASHAAAGIPARFRAGDQTWTAFAARARVLLINTQPVKEADRPTSIKDLLEPRWQGKVAMAMPQFGTTATQAACFFEAWGEAEATRFYAGLRERGVRLLPGNKHVAEAVGKGDYAVGLTDTDDAMAEVDAGKPVVLLFTEKETLFIPNTVAIIKNCPNPAGARKLVDFLLSPEVEARLAKSASRQIPLNPAVKVDLPSAMQAVRNVKPMAVDFASAAQNWEKWQNILVRTLNLPK